MVMALYVSRYITIGSQIGKVEKDDRARRKARPFDDTPMTDSLRAGITAGD
jgi:hypothetical protein